MEKPRPQPVGAGKGLEVHEVVAAVTAAQRMCVWGAASAAAMPGQLCISCHILVQRAAEEGGEKSASREAPETHRMVGLSPWAADFCSKTPPWLLG